MNPREFCYWLQGSLELGNQSEGWTPAQVDMVRKHLALVFANVTKNEPIDRTPLPFPHVNRRDIGRRDIRPGTLYC